MSNGGSGGSSGSGGVSGAGMEPTSDAGPETGAGNGGSSDFMYPADCPVPTPIKAKPDQVVVIQSINFETSEIVIRNVSSEPLEIQGGEMGWQWCNAPYYNSVVLEDVTLESDQTLAFKPINQGRVWPLYRGDDAGDTNEMAIYTTTGSFMTAELMSAFAIWGAGARTSRESVATQAELWIFMDRIEIGPNDDGFIITGNADEGVGYTSVPERCLVAPPNPPGTVLPMASQ